MVLATAWKATSWSIRGFCLVHFIHSHIYEFSETHGESMLPTLNYSGDFVHTNKTCGLGRGCKVGDMIVASKPTDPEQRVCKRITGMPGDIILVDPSAASEENADAAAKETAMNNYIKVPEGHCWITGENLGHSLDSRSYGVMPLGLIKGKIFAVHTSDGNFKWMPNTFRPYSGDV